MGIQVTKNMAALLVFMTKEDDKNSFVKEHQYGGY